MINAEALEQLMEALNKLLGDSPEEEGDEAEGEDKPKKKAMTIISIGKPKSGKGGLKIPKMAKQEDEEDAG
jgi:hypothetical protein